MLHSKRGGRPNFPAHDLGVHQALCTQHTQPHHEGEGIDGKDCAPSSLRGVSRRNREVADPQGGVLARVLDLVERDRPVELEGDDVLDELARRGIASGPFDHSVQVARGLEGDSEEVRQCFMPSRSTTSGVRPRGQFVDEIEGLSQVSIRLWEAVGAGVKRSLGHG